MACPRADLNVEWALDQLAAFINLTQMHYPPDPPSIVSFSGRMATSGSESDILQAAVAVEPILQRVVPRWRSDLPDKKSLSVNKWCQNLEAAQRAQAHLLRAGSRPARGVNDLRAEAPSRC